MGIHGFPDSALPTAPAHFLLESAIRPNILALHPYRCARDDYQAGILLDANENALGHSIAPDVDTDEATLRLPLHRYPDPSHANIKSLIAALRELPGPENVFLGVGSDEVIDLLQRVFVVPGGKEKILITPPTYGMYSVCAQVNDVGVIKVPLQLSGSQGEGGQSGRFSLPMDEVRCVSDLQISVKLNLEQITKAVDADPSIKLIFLCSPGNPTGTLLPLSSIRAVLSHPNFKGVIVVDEAYIDFAGGNSVSAASLLSEFSNLVVMQTLSKGFGLAAIRLGIALAHPAIIQVLTNTKAPYNISTPTAALALSALSPASLALTRTKIQTLIEQRGELLRALAEPKLTVLGVGTAVGGHNANFVLVPIHDKDGTGKPDNERALKVYKSLAEEQGVVVRFRGNEPGCEGCLRITVGGEEETAAVVGRLGDVLEAL
ncbi:hypothetical protein DXG03_008670 [Asterophora parasitica]|uniref:histidinol-phosphate transaminase n=1 Tax=Asterophora parasitica TaxID=117018 RepID=A0A9P7G4N8_9AGAR|nr:hypothetical protein DXG03_008670 [Asterophora parasitica]